MVIWYCLDWVFIVMLRVLLVGWGLKKGFLFCVGVFVVIVFILGGFVYVLILIFFVSLNFFKVWWRICIK